MTDATKLAACPLCSDPMKVSNSGTFGHTDSDADCLLAKHAWGHEPRFVAAWNLRSRPDTSAGVEEVERVAEVMWREESRRASGRDRLVLWADANPEIADNWRGLARAAIAALSPTAEQRAATAALAGEDK